MLVLFGLIGQIAWAVENMYFNLFVYDTVAKDLNAVTLMVQLSGVMATVATLLAGALSDKAGNRKAFVSWGYVVWGVTVALFGTISPSLMQTLGFDENVAVQAALVAVVTGDCVMTLFGSSANDAAFNAWVTDNTEKDCRGKVEGVLSTFPLLSMLIVAGAFGLIVEAIGYTLLFALMGLCITACGVAGFFLIKDSPSLTKNGRFRDLFYGFTPKVVKENKKLYLSLCVVLVYGVACQIFMPYMIIYMKEYLSFSVLEYSIVFGLAILLGSAVNLYLTRLSDKKDKAKMLYIAAGVFAVGLLGMYFSKDMDKIPTLILFGGFGFVMITGYILVSALCGALVRDYTPNTAVGKLQGVRMTFSVLVPMVVGPMIGNAINAARNIPLPDTGSADMMTTQFIPAPEIYLAAAFCALLIFAIVPLLVKEKNKENGENI